MRSKLNLTDQEIMQSSWISLQLQMIDFPYYKYKGKDEPIRVTDKKKADEILSKYMK